MEDPKHAALRMGNETKAPNTPVLVIKNQAREAKGSKLTCSQWLPKQSPSPVG